MNLSYDLKISEKLFTLICDLVVKGEKYWSFSQLDFETQADIVALVIKDNPKELEFIYECHDLSQLICNTVYATDMQDPYYDQTVLSKELIKAAIKYYNKALQQVFDGASSYVDSPEFKGPDYDAE